MKDDETKFSAVTYVVVSTILHEMCEIGKLKNKKTDTKHYGEAIDILTSTSDIKYVRHDMKKDGNDNFYLSDAMVEQAEGVLKDKGIEPSEVKKDFTEPTK